MINKFLKAFFFISLAFAMLFYGYFAHKLKLPPYEWLDYAEKEAPKLVGEKKWFYRKTDRAKQVSVFKEGKVHEGLTLITSIGKNKNMSIKVIELDGTVVHEWTVNWFDVWGNSSMGHVPQDKVPQVSPGTQIHGIELLADGSVIFNLEGLGLVRMDLCGKVIWKLERPTHHFVYQDEAGDFWVGGRIWHEAESSKYPNHIPPYIEDTILKVSGEGEILKEISIFELLKKNSLQGLLYIYGTELNSTEVTDDSLHLNDFEIFPLSMEEGVFKHGDIMISLRHINAVLIFDPETEIIKHISIGEMIRQHDPDFISGHEISIFDNYDAREADRGYQSRILIKSFEDQSLEVYFEGTNKRPFFTDVMGKHQWLANGNLLITESMKGRVFEIDQDKKKVWEYFNILEKKKRIGIISEAKRLPEKFNRKFFDQKTSGCLMN